MTSYAFVHSHYQKPLGVVGGRADTTGRGTGTGKASFMGAERAVQSGRCPRTSKASPRMQIKLLLLQAKLKILSPK